MTTPPDTLARIKQLHEAATPGPWKADWTDSVHGPVSGISHDVFWMMDCAKEDAAFIAELRNALPGILADLQKLREVEEAAAEHPGVSKLAHKLHAILTRQPS